MSSQAIRLFLPLPGDLHVGPPMTPLEVLAVLTIDFDNHVKEYNLGFVDCTDASYINSPLSPRNLIQLVRC